MPGLPTNLFSGGMLSGLTSALDLSGFSDRPTMRSIDPERYNLMAEVTIDEDGDDELEITQHPVEYGASISDHAYKRPPEVRLRVGWSNAYVGDVKTVYEQIIALQTERRPFWVYTGKRAYKEMLVASIRQHTDAKLEYSFIADITFRQIIRVSTQTIQSQVPTNEAQLSDPQSNLPEAAQGKRATTEASLSPRQVASAGGNPAKMTNIEQAPSSGFDPVTGSPIGGGGGGGSGGGPQGPIDSRALAGARGKIIPFRPWPPPRRPGG